MSFLSHLLIFSTLYLHQYKLMDVSYLLLCVLIHTLHHSDCSRVRRWEACGSPVAVTDAQQRGWWCVRALP